MRYASSANDAWSDARSASEYTAIARTPSSCSVRKIRIAISPRLATSTLENGGMVGVFCLPRRPCLAVRLIVVLARNAFLERGTTPRADVGVGSPSLVLEQQLEGKDERFPLRGFRLGPKRVHHSFRVNR